MPLVKQFNEGEISELEHKPDIKPIVLNTPLSPIEYGNKYANDLKSEHLNILNEETGINKNLTTQTAGGNLRRYKVLDKNAKLNIFKSCCSSEAALKAFTLLRKKNIKKRKITLLDINTNRRYKYALSNNSLKREKL
tara:strand:+ start:4892 stop:5302 length:411 start_codon:yes stop_codon:yes gene_type:complete